MAWHGSRFKRGQDQSLAGACVEWHGWFIFVYTTMTLAAECVGLYILRFPQDRSTTRHWCTCVPNTDRPLASACATLHWRILQRLQDRRIAGACVRLHVSATLRTPFRSLSGFWLLVISHPLQPWYGLAHSHLNRPRKNFLRLPRPASPSSKSHNASIRLF